MLLFAEGTFAHHPHSMEGNIYDVANEHFRIHFENTERYFEVPTFALAAFDSRPLGLFHGIVCPLQSSFVLSYTYACEAIHHTWNARMAVVA